MAGHTIAGSGSDQREHDGTAAPIPARAPNCFLNLPTEIRIEIYGLVFNKVTTMLSPASSTMINIANKVDCTTKLFTATQQLPARIRKIVKPTTEHVSQPSRCLTVQCVGCNELRDMRNYCWKCLNGGAGLLLASRQTYLEAIPYAYERRRFTFMYDENLLNFIVATESHRHSHLVKRMDFFVPIEISGINKRSLHDLFIHMRPNALQNIFPNLKRVVITYDDQDYPPDHPAARKRSQIIGQIASNVTHGLQGYGDELQVRVRGLNDQNSWESLAGDPTITSSWEGFPRGDMSDNHFNDLLALLRKHLAAPLVPAHEWKLLGPDTEPDEAVRLTV